MDVIEGPRIVSRAASHYLGIRVVTPFRGMLGVRDKLMGELFGWLDDKDITGAGPAFLRLHVIDMEGPMDLEFGVVTGQELAGDGRVRPGILPAGRYANLTYVNHARRANRTLLEWVQGEDVALDRWDEAAGDAFACRYEAYLTDPRSEPKKTKWQVDLNIRVVDDGR